MRWGGGGEEDSRRWGRGVWGGGGRGRYIPGGKWGRRGGGGCRAVTTTNNRRNDCAPAPVLVQTDFGGQGDWEGAGADVTRHCPSLKQGKGIKSEPTQARTGSRRLLWSTNRALARIVLPTMPSRLTPPPPPPTSSFQPLPAFLAPPPCVPFGAVVPRGLGGQSASDTGDLSSGSHFFSSSLSLTISDLSCVSFTFSLFFTSAGVGAKKTPPFFSLFFFLFFFLFLFF